MNYPRFSKRQAQAAPNRYSPTSFSPDGTCRRWNEMSDPLQIAYLDGFLGGLELGALHGVVECVMESGAPAATTGRSKVNKIVARFTVPGITLDEIREGVTRICKIGENSLSGISGALEAFIMEVKGKPQSDIDAYLNIARQGVIMHPDSDKGANK